MVDFTQVGNSLLICCPFHQEKTPSFQIECTTLDFYCMGCGKQGKVGDDAAVTKQLLHIIVTIKDALLGRKAKKESH